ncbi:allergen Fel d 4 isoform X2 [Desmodus rotundus]|uniref:allergen Fel d 4 isoform X2 n=1 Tax=Desmodus rotundus TaxID=9430 RepID=UPI0023814D58|nr:allergen Fel d 4 isoform X2 [Desmodus rotundus]
MKLLLLCLGLTLVWVHCEENHEVVKCNFNMSQISGEWYTIFLATNRKKIIQETGDRRIFVESIQTLDNSSLLFKYHMKIKGECIEFTFVTDETKEKGVYSVIHEGNNTFHIIEAVYNEYVIFYQMIFGKGKKTEVIELNARNPDVRQDLKERFEEICQNRGIQKKNILDIPVSTPEGAREPRFPGGCCMMGSGCSRGHCSPTQAVLDAQRLQYSHLVKKLVGSE